MDHPMHDRERPPSLREVLDAGCDLAATGVWLDGLAEDIYNNLPFYPPQERARRASNHRAIAEDLILLGEESRFAVTTSAGPIGTDREFITLELWRAEIFEDQRLADRLKDVLPPDVTVEYRAEADCWRRPHPIEIKVPEQWWHCNNCGSAFDQGEQEAVIVTGRKGVSELDYDIEYCLDCIRMVALVIGEGQPTHDGFR